jgi:4-hydroxybenzoate polyprenyltransferase/phosphoserine phosphatase
LDAAERVESARLVGSAAQAGGDLSVVPLCIDCDGTLIRTDLLHESVFLLLKQAPLSLLKLPFWLARGRAHMKERIAATVSFSGATLPFNDDVVALAREAVRDGRKLVLATASPRAFAEQVAARCPLAFDEVFASEHGRNLAGQHKALALVQRFGARGFDYVGNGRSDLPVWAAARAAIVVSADRSLAAAAAATTSVERVVALEPPRVHDYARALRVHQWLKNLLVFVPVLAAHRIDSLETMLAAGWTFVAFCLVASAAYVLNDLLDLESDRRHVRKRARPFASGRVPVWHGAVALPALLGLALVVALRLPWGALAILACYCACTLAYSLRFKRQPVVDVMMLAGLYTLRVIGGSAATGIDPSFWLLAFCMFIFLSLAIVKRYSELSLTLKRNELVAAGRGYSVNDLPALMALGASSGMIAVLVLALYLNQADVAAINHEVRWLWLMPPLLLYWICRLWMKAHRGEVHDDPVVFAVSDWQSLLALSICAGLFLAATP